MQINKINSQNFSGLYIDKSVAVPLMMQADEYMHSQRDIKLLFDKMDKCKHTQYADVFVTKNCKTYVKDKKTKCRIFTATDKPLFYQYYLALTKALVMDDCYKKGENPYELIL